MLDLSDEAVGFFIGFVGKILSSNDLSEDERFMLDCAYEELMNHAFNTHTTAGEQHNYEGDADE